MVGSSYVLQAISYLFKAIKNSQMTHMVDVDDKEDLDCLLP